MLGVSLAQGVVFLSVLTVPLAAGSALDLGPARLAAWISGLYGVPSILGIMLSARYRQPLQLTGTLFAIVFVASLGDQIPYAELAGSFMVAGAIVALLGATGLTPRIARLIPTPVVVGLLAGAVLPFVVNVFNSLGADPLAVGLTLAAYLLASRWFGLKPLAVVPALLTGILVVLVTGSAGELPNSWIASELVLTLPAFSAAGLLTVTPVVIVFMTLQANVPSSVYLRGQEFEPPVRTVDLASGVGTMLGSLLGPVAVSMSLPATSLIAGDDGGEHAGRHRAVYLVSAIALAIAIVAGAAAALADLLPRTLLLTLAGLALLSVFLGALRQMVGGPLVFGPAVAFVVAVSDLTLLGFGSFFWALVFGIGVSYLLEGGGLARLRQDA